MLYCRVSYRGVGNLGFPTPRKCLPPPNIIALKNTIILFCIGNTTSRTDILKWLVITVARIRARVMPTCTSSLALRKILV